MSERNLLDGLSSELADLVQKVRPSVVRVDDGSRLTASGVVWTADGVIVATSHGIDKDEGLQVEMDDGTRYSATIAGRDPETDLAALRVATSGLTVIERAGVQDARVGQLAIALGRPGESGLQATIGIVGARMETESEGQIGFVLHTDAVLYPGFSGGPLIDVQGRMLGINNLVYGRGRGVAVGTPIVDQVITSLLAHGKVQHAYLGIRSQTVALPESLRTALSLEESTGVLIVQVDAGTPAEAAGLLLGDTLLAIDGQTTADVDGLRERLRGLAVAQTVSLKILRAGAVRQLSATLGAQG